MAELKTKPTDDSVADFIARVEDDARRAASARIVELLTEATGSSPTLWSTSIIGFGTYTYRYASGTTGTWMRVGFSPRKAALTFYGIRDNEGAEALLQQLGPHTDGKGCVYVKKFDLIDQDVLAKLAKLGMGPKVGEVE